MHPKFHIPAPQWPDEAKVIDAISQCLAAGQGGTREAVPVAVVKGMADVATHVWRAKNRMLAPGSAEPRDEVKKIFRHVESALQSLAQIGLEVRDNTGDAYDGGLPLKVISTQQTAGLIRETIIETLRPTVLWNAQMIQLGEVIVGAPISQPSEQ